MDKKWEPQEWKEIIAERHIFIQSLFEKVHFIFALYEGIRKTFTDLHAIMQEKIAPKESAIVYAMESQWTEFDRQWSEMNFQMMELLKRENLISKELGLSALTVEGSTLAVNGVPHRSTGDATRAFETVLRWYDLSRTIEDNTNLDMMGSENKLLRIQVGNAKSIVMSTLVQLKTLTQIIENQGKYIDSVEIEIAKYAEHERFLIANNQKVQEARSTIIGLLNQANEKELQYKTEIKNLTAQLDNQNNHCELLQNELEVLKETVAHVQEGLSPDTAAEKAFLEKVQKAVFLLKEKLEGNFVETKLILEEMKRNEKDSASLKAELEAALKERDSLLEKSLIMKEELALTRKVVQTHELKIKVLAGSLTQVRQASLKVNEENQRLKDDRLEVINKTFEAIKRHKSLEQKSRLLDQQVQAEIQKREELTEKNTTLKTKERELTKEFAILQKRVGDVEEENKKLRQEAVVTSSKPQTDMELAKSLMEKLHVSERKNDELREGKKELTRQLGDMKKKAEDLERDVRNMTVKLQRADQQMKNLKKVI